MNRSFLLLIFVALGLVPLPMRAQTVAPLPAPPPSLTWTLTPALVSQYMFRGMRNSGTAFQPTLEYGYGSLVAGFWGNFPLTGKVPGVSDPELDLYASYTVPLTSEIALVPGATWYHFPRADRSAGFYRQTFEPNLAFTYTVDGFRLTPKLYYDFILEGFTGEVAAFYAYPLTRIGSELDFTATLGSFLWRDAVERAATATKNWGDYWSVGVAMPYQVSRQGRVILGYSYAKGTNNYFKEGAEPRVRNPAAIGRGVVSLMFSLGY